MMDLGDGLDAKVANSYRLSRPQRLKSQKPKVLIHPRGLSVDGLNHDTNGLPSSHANGPLQNVSQRVYLRP